VEAERSSVLYEIAVPVQSLTILSARDAHSIVAERLAGGETEGLTRRRSSRDSAPAYVLVVKSQYSS